MKKPAMPRIAVVLLLTSCASAAGAAEPFEPFIGTYVGQAESQGLAEEAKPQIRDLDVIIRERNNGFLIQSVTVNHHGDRLDPDVSRRSSAMSFRESDIDEVYERDFERDVFTTRGSLDIVDGDPLQWARVEGDTLLVHSFVLDEVGSYELHTYWRTRDDLGLALEFVSERNGAPVRRVSGQLIRVEDVMDDINP